MNFLARSYLDCGASRVGNFRTRGNAAARVHRHRNKIYRVNFFAQAI